MSEVLRVAIQRVDLRPLRAHPDPVVLRGITIAPKHGVQVEVVRARQGTRVQAGGPAVPAAAA